MENSKIREYWESLQNKELIHEPPYPLAHLEDPIRYFCLSPLPGSSEKLVAFMEPISVEPSFANCSKEILLWLRVQLYYDKSQPVVSTWAEKLMRFCELRLPTLRKRCLGKCKTPSNARLLMLHLTAFLLDYAIYSKDARYLNTALKLTDLKWILDQKWMHKDLSSSQRAEAVTLFQVRVLLLNEYALDRLSKGISL